MNLIINGDSHIIPDQVKTISDLLAHFDLQDKIVVVELNYNILSKEQHQDTVLSDGDKIEIVHFVGGG